MTNAQGLIRGSFLVGLIAFASACVVAEPREGFYDRDHHRYYREHTWHECTEHEHSEYCR
jgi:hypothetical protein